jgi:transposase-like protein
LDIQRLGVLRFNGQKKYSPEFKQQVVLHYLFSSDGAKKTARLFGVDHGAVRRWTEHWKVNGMDSFTIPTRAYSAEFKESVVLWMQQHNKSSGKLRRSFVLQPLVLSANGSVFTVLAVSLPYRINPEDAR